MAVELPIRFGNRSSAPAAQAEDREPSQFWLNVGVETEDEEYPFLSVPMGIPLDSVQPLKVSGKNEKFKQFRAAQNDLLSQIMEIAQSLKPGEDAVINLKAQVRRIDDAQPQTISEGNVFAVKLK